MKGKVKCTCGWSWNKSDSSAKDMYICHECGRDNSNNMKNGGWLDDIPQAQRGKKKIKSPQYIDITKEYNIPQFTEQYINKAIELDKKYPGAKFVCDANGCADIASRAANAMGYDFGKANAWDYGNRSDIVFTNPSYVEELENPTGPLHDPTSYDVPKELLGMKNVLVGLNRKNNLLDAKGKKVRNVPDAQQIAAAKNRQEANDSTDYANQDLYEGSRGYEHIGYMLDNNNLLHGTAANEDHPAFFVVDDINDGINLSGYGKYEPVEVIAEPTMLQSLGNKAKALGNKVKEALFEDATVDKLKPPTKKKKNGGWLDNYNDSKASAPEGMVGDGFSNVGRNYSPAWGGQFQDGGNVSDEDYNMKRALELGYTADESGHWPSVDYETGEWLKSKKHHTRGMEMMAYELNPELRNKYNLIENEKGKLQYVPKLQKIEEYQMGGNVYPVNYVPQAAMGASIPGSVGFTYARTNDPAPSEGPYAKKTMASAKDGDVIKDDRGQWDHPGEITEINSNDITMEGVPYDVLGISDTGDTKLMKPGKNYKFKGKKVTEFPMAKNGLRQEQKSLQNLDNLLNFTNYNKPQPGGWLNKYN